MYESYVSRQILQRLYCQWQLLACKSTTVASLQPICRVLGSVWIWTTLQAPCRHTKLSFPFQSILLRLVRIHQRRNTQMFRAFMASGITGLHKLRLVHRITQSSLKRWSQIFFTQCRARIFLVVFCTFKTISLIEV